MSVVVLDRIGVSCASGCLHELVVASAGWEDRWAAVAVADGDGWLRAVETTQDAGGQIAAANMVALFGVPRARLAEQAIEQISAQSGFSFADMYWTAGLSTPAGLRALSDAVFPWSPAAVLAALKTVVAAAVCTQ